MDQLLLHPASFTKNGEIHPSSALLRGNLNGLKEDISKSEREEKILAYSEKIIDWLEDWVDIARGSGAIDIGLTEASKKSLSPITEDILGIFGLYYGKNAREALRMLFQSKESDEYTLKLDYSFDRKKSQYKIDSLLITSRNP